MTSSVRILLKPKQLLLLREVLAGKLPTLAQAYRDETGDLVVDPRDARRILDAISDEFVETGLGDEDEPNARGLALEELIDVFARVACDS
jgi:hypothetical protein